MNGLIRQYLPKGIDLNRADQHYLNQNCHVTEYSSLEGVRLAYTIREGANKRGILLG